MASMVITKQMVKSQYNRESVDFDGLADNSVLPYYVLLMETQPWG